jgi:hypothetical protein
VIICDVSRPRATRSDSLTTPAAGERLGHSKHPSQLVTLPIGPEIKRETRESVSCPRVPTFALRRIFASTVVFRFNIASLPDTHAGCVPSSTPAPAHARPRSKTSRGIETERRGAFRWRLRPGLVAGSQLLSIDHTMSGSEEPQHMCLVHSNSPSDAQRPCPALQALVHRSTATRSKCRARNFGVRLMQRAARTATGHAKPSD